MTTPDFVASVGKAVEESLRNQCKMCGNCCREQGSPPFADELDTRPKEIIAIVDWFSNHDPYRYEHNKECYFLGTDNKCLIYAHRPVACREFEPGGQDIGEKAMCPQSREPVTVEDASDD